MKKKTTKKATKTENPEQIHKGKQITIDRAKLIVSYYIANNCSNKTQALVQAGYSAKTATYNSTRIFNDSRIKEELNRQLTPVVAQSQITLITLQNKLNKIAQDVLDVGDMDYYPTAISAINSLLKTIGGFQKDREPPENLAGKLLDAKRAEEVNKVLNAYYSSKYLAVPPVITVESICKDIEGQELTNSLQVVSPCFPDDKKTETEFPETDPVTPQVPPPSLHHSPLLTHGEKNENFEKEEDAHYPTEI